MAAATETVSLDLTHLQRASLREYFPYFRAIQDRIAGLRGNVHPIPLTPAELDDLAADLEYLAGSARAPHARRLAAVRRRVEAAIARRREAAERHAAAVARLRPPEPTRVPGLVFQFRIALHGVDRPVWRTFQVEDDDLFAFDYALKAVMGWDDESGRHRLAVGRRAFGPRLTWDHLVVTEGDWTDERSVFLHDVFAAGTVGEYTSDPAAGWKHAIACESIVPWDFDTDYPVCLAGAGACPPDGAGGPAAYNAYLAGLAPLPAVVVANLARGRRAFDPAAFDVAAVNAGLADWDYLLHLRRQGWSGGGGQRPAARSTRD